MTPKRKRYWLRIAIDLCAMAGVYWTSPPWSMAVTAVYGLWCFHAGYTHRDLPE